MKISTSKLSQLFFFLFSLVIICPQIAAQAQNPCDFPVFTGGREFVPSNAPYGVAVGDVNNDGKQDVVTANYNASYAETGNITVFLGTGTGDFSSIKDFSAGTYAWFISLGELNGDGNLDAVVYTHVNNQIRILLGDGAGNFTLTNTYTFYSPRKIEIADFNKDGKSDLVVTNGDWYAGKISVYLGIGNGAFDNPIDTIIPGGTTPTLAIDDFNRDGKLDFAAFASSNLSIWLGDGTGRFAMNWSSNQTKGLILTGNLNNDNYPDLAIGSDGFFQIFIGSGDGSFQIGERYNSEGDGAGAEYKIVDLNRDGWNDIINLSFATGDVGIFLATGNGRFKPAKYQPVGYRPTSFDAGDFNGDGFQDVVTIGHETKLIRLTLGKGDGTFSAPAKLGVNVGGNYRGIAVADLNRDGKDDIVTANFGAWGVSVLLRTGDYRFAPPRNFVQSGGFSFVSVADFNSDGKLDIAAVGGNTGIVLLGDGQGDFTAAGTLPTGETGSQVVFVGSADFNGDGKLDLVASNQSLDRILIYQGKGDGTFAPPTAYLITSIYGTDPPSRIAIGDFNGDNRPDLAIVVDTSSSLQGRVQIRLNQGDGTFPAASSEYNLGFAIHPKSVITNDFNGDGKLDFAVTTDRDPLAPGRVWIFKGAGNGTFSFSNTYSVGDTFPYDLISRDFNNDGILDIASVNYLLSNDVSIFAGNGDATFRLVQTIPAGAAPQMIVAGNFNGDESPDLLVNSAGLAVVKNKCNQAAEVSESATEYDFDGDGRADVSVFRDGAWYLNRSQAGFIGLNWGLPTDVLAPADFDGDRKTDLAVFRDGNWYWINSSTNQISAVQFGQAGDIPVPADFDGDGRADVSVFRPQNGAWYRLNSSNNSFYGEQFGSGTDKAVPAAFAR